MGSVIDNILKEFNPRYDYRRLAELQPITIDPQWRDRVKNLSVHVIQIPKSMVRGAIYGGIVGATSSVIAGDLSLEGITTNAVIGAYIGNWLDVGQYLVRAPYSSL